MEIGELSELTHLVVGIAQRAGNTIMESYKKAHQIDVKTHVHDVTTPVDRLVEKQIIDELKLITPKANFLGEETGEETEVSPLKWIIDPIDGTRYFARNLPMFALSIALTYDRDHQIGVIHMPTTGQTFYGFRNGGSYLDGLRLYVSKVVTLSDSIVYVDVDSLQKLLSEEKEWFAKKMSILLRTCYRVRMFGSSSIAATWVATNAIDAFIDMTGYNPLWDMVAPQVIMSEAGARQGHITVGCGPPRYIAANPILWELLFKLLTN